MSDVFISYRRSGVDLDWAGRIHDALREDFAVFFDTHIDPGESIRANIDDALKRCRVFLPVVGPGWMAAKTRLFEEDDWVRYEILTVLKRGPGVLVLPLQRRDSPFPKTREQATDYPGVLGDLFDRKGFELSHDNWDADVTRLKQRLHQELAGTQRAMASRGALPLILPYLCDRFEQEDHLVDEVPKVDTASGPLVCVMHGSRPEEHMRFLERLQRKKVLDGLFGDGGPGVALHRLDWNQELVRAGRLEDFLRHTLKRQALKQPTAKNDQLLKFLQAPGRAQVFALIVTEDDLKEHGFELLGRLTQAWRNLFGTDTIPSHPMVLWLNVFHAEAALPWQPPASTLVLPMLRPLKSGDIERWSVQDDVQPYLGDREAEVQAILESASCRPGNGAVHMELFAREVQRILR